MWWIIVSENSSARVIGRSFLGNFTFQRHDCTLLLRIIASTDMVVHAYKYRDHILSPPPHLLSSIFFCVLFLRSIRNLIRMTYFHVWQPTGGFMRLACSPPVQPKLNLNQSNDWKPNNSDALAILAALSTVPLPHSALATGLSVRPQASSASIPAPKVKEYNYSIVPFSHRDWFFVIATASSDEE